MLASENGHKEVALATLGAGADKDGKSNVGLGPPLCLGIEGCY